MADLLRQNVQTSMLLSSLAKAIQIMDPSQSQDVPSLPPPVLRCILRSLKRRGFTLSADALPTLTQLYHSSNDTDVNQFTSWLLDRITHLTGESLITTSCLEGVREGGDRNVGAGEIMEVVDAFDIGVEGIRGGRKGRGRGRGFLMGKPDMKSEMFRRRWRVIMERVLQHGMFCKGRSHFGGGVGVEQGGLIRLTGVDSLENGGDGQKYVLGMLVEGEEGVYGLEDLHGMVKLDLGHAAEGDGVLPGLYCEGAFVIVQGVYRSGEANGEGVLEVSVLGMPPMPTEEWVVSGSDVERGIVERLKAEPERMESLRKHEKEKEGAMFVFLSDVHLDKPAVFAGLRRLFNGYLIEDAAPMCLVLMGDFLSHPFGQKSGDVANLGACFTRLGKLIEEEFPQLLTETLFIVVPGPNDPGCSGILPRPPLPRCITGGFLDVFPRANPVRSMSNPCRVRYCAQEIVLFREDLLHKIVRHCVLPIHQNKDRGELLVQTLVEQAHLVPLPNSIRPILWAHDTALLLVPNPRLLVLGDTGEQYSYTYQGTTGLNPGCFARDFSFSVYWPSAKRTERCSLSYENHDDDNETSQQNEENDLAHLEEIDPSGGSEEDSERYDVELANIEEVVEDDGNSAMIDKNIETGDLEEAASDEDVGSEEQMEFEVDGEVGREDADELGRDEESGVETGGDSGRDQDMMFNNESDSGGDVEMEEVEEVDGGRSDQDIMIE